MIDYLLRPRGALTVGIVVSVVSVAFSNFVHPLLFMAIQSVGDPMVVSFTSWAVSVLGGVTGIGAYVGPMLIVASLVMLKMERAGTKKRAGVEIL